MPACALCENVQAAGEACEVCGHPFPAAERVPLPVEALEGLESTSLPTAEVAAERLPELETTGVDPVQLVVGVMDALLPTEVEGIPEDLPAASPRAATCRYCGTPAVVEEVFCDHCGMRLAGGAGSPDELPPEIQLCRDCGTPVKGASCPGCGARVSR